MATVYRDRSHINSYINCAYVCIIREPISRSAVEILFLLFIKDTLLKMLFIKDRAHRRVGSALHGISIYDAIFIISTN